MNAKDYYNLSPEQEWERLDIHSFEFLMTKYFLAKYIHRGAKVLDIGAGPGRYSMYLTQLGNEVTLFDISNKNIEFAKQKAQSLQIEIKNYICGDALKLCEYTDNIFDVVLCMGPLYHLTDEIDRKKVILNCIERLPPSGIFICTFISKYAKLTNLPFKIKSLLTDCLSVSEIEAFIKDRVSIIEKQIDDLEAFFIRDVEIPVAQVNPEKITSYMESFGLETLLTGVIEGVFENNIDIRNLPDHLIRMILELNYKISTKPVMWGNGSHFIYIGKK